MSDVLPHGARRGTDLAVLGIVKALHEEFTDAHFREHVLIEQWRNDALALAGTRIDEKTSELSHFYDTVLKERDERFKERFDSHEKALASADHASDRRVSAAFQASQAAIDKSEKAQEEKNKATYVSLQDLSKALGILMPAKEADTHFASQDEKIASLTSRIDKYEGQATAKERTSASTIAILALVAVMGSTLLTAVGILIGHMK